MTSLVARTLGTVALVGAAIGAAAVPAAAVDNTFQLAHGGVTASGTYDRMMSIPERPVPPVRVAGTLVVDSANRCGVVQIAQSGPADRTVWHTVAGRCGAGATTFTVNADLLRGSVDPDVRLCEGATPWQAVRGASCTSFTPAAG
ncbi:hypothetical protein [Thalassiella azotivora]